MGEVRLGIDIDRALDLKRRYELRCFVETGTYKGGTTRQAAEWFDHVWTIEGDPARFSKTIASFAGHKPLNVKFILADSRKALAGVLEEAGEPCLLWLDAHWCGGGALQAHELGDECPLHEELEQILASPYAEQHVILIDDARLFTAPPPYPHDPAQWMTYAEIEAVLQPRELYIVEDVIYAEPVR